MIPTREQFRAMTLAEKIACDPDVGSAERLRRVADIIELHPENHDQETWWHGPGSDSACLEDEGRSYSPSVPRGVLTSVPEAACSTTCCGAGWLVVLSPLRIAVEGEKSLSTRAWFEAGMIAGGLTTGVASILFADRVTDRDLLVKAYREMAEVPAEERTLANFPWLADLRVDEHPDA